MRADQGLIEMMVGVDESGKHDLTRGVEGLVDRKRRHSPSTDEFDDARPLHHQAAFRARPEQGEGILDPKPHAGRFLCCSAAVVRGLAPERLPLPVLYGEGSGGRAPLPRARSVLRPKSPLPRGGGVTEPFSLRHFGRRSTPTPLLTNCVVNAFL